VRRCGDAPRLDVRRESADDPSGRALLDGFRAEMAQRYGAFDELETPSATPQDLGPPGGAFLVAYAGERAVACGGIKRLGTDLGEVKRMFVAPAARGRGVARALLAELEATARSLGYARLRLDTGDRQPEARALYEAAGYRAIPDYNDNPYAHHWFEKDLAPDP